MLGAEQENTGTSTWRWLGKQRIQRRGRRRDVERRRHAYIKYFSRLTECQVILVTSVMKHLWGTVSLRTTHQAFPIHTAPKFKPKGESRWREIWGKIRQGKPGCCLWLCRGTLHYSRKTILIRVYVNSTPIELDLAGYIKLQAEVLYIASDTASYLCQHSACH